MQPGAKVDERIFDDLECIHPDTVGIDIGSETHYVSVPPDRDEQPVRHFGCTTPDVQEMAEWMIRCRVRTAVMESTGVYWVTAYNVLTKAGIEVLLVDAHHAKNVPGRKTDVWDCRWLRQLHSYGLLRGCFIPPLEIQKVRTYWRHRGSLIQACTQQIHLMQKSLEQMNLHLHKVISDLTGVTKMILLRAIIAGEHDPTVLAKMEHPAVKCSDEEIIKALTGNYSEEHLFTLAQAMETYEFYQRQMRECDKKVADCMGRFADKDGGAGKAEPRKPAKGESGKNYPHFDLGGQLARIMGVDLTKIESIGTLTAQVVFTEVGTNVDKFPTVAHWSSWLALCPNNRVTGGRVRSSRTRKSASRVATAFRVAAQILEHSQSALGAWFRRTKARLGAPKAITAAAHKLARIVYHMLKYGEAYVAEGQQQYEARHKEQSIRRLKKQAATMGMTLVCQATGEIVG